MQSRVTSTKRTAVTTAAVAVPTTSSLSMLAATAIAIVGLFAVLEADHLMTKILLVITLPLSMFVVVRAFRLVDQTRKN